MASTRRPLITFLSDFGIGDAYVAEVKGVLLSIAPDATIVDISHLVPAQDNVRGAMLLASAFQRFPTGTIHLAVVDPGVGTFRRAVAAEAGGHRFVGPDNGLLSLAFDSLGGFRARQPHEQVGDSRATPRPLADEANVVVLDQPRFWLQPVSTTFHARDLFGPVAANLANGVSLSEVGSRIGELSDLQLERPRLNPMDGRSVDGSVLAIDHFGNLVTNLRAADLPATPDSLLIRILDHEVRGIVETYGSTDGLTALIGSGGYLEIAVPNGSAAVLLGAEVGTIVTIRVMKRDMD